MKPALVSFLVRDYDEAIAYFTSILGFALLEDKEISASKRWVRVYHRSGLHLLLAQARNSAQNAALGRQAGDRVGFFLFVEDFAREYEHMQKSGVNFLETPRRETYGWVVQFHDLYGNKWDLLSQSGDAAFVS